MSASRTFVCALSALVFSALLAGCDNSPHPKGSEATNTLFVAFQERSPRHLDPTASYSLNETPYLFSVYEPLYATVTSPLACWM